MKKVVSLILLAGFLVLGTLILAMAGEKKQMGHMNMEQMKAEMSKCMVCKNIIPHMDKTWGKVNHEVYDLKNGMMMVNTVTDKAILPDYKAMCTSMSTALNEYKKLSEAEAKAKGCEHCQKLHKLGKSGAEFETVQTENGSIMILTTNKPETVKKIHTFAEETRLMFNPHTQAQSQED